VRLAQLRFRRGAAAIADDALSALDREQQLVSGAAADIAGGIALSADLAGGGNGIIGYRAKRHTGLIDVDRAGAYPLADYWEPIAAGPDKLLILDPDQFYILASKEAVHVPPTHAAEMIPFNPLVGEFRVHYAGFFDPGFGHAASGGTGSRAVLEVRSHKVPFILEDGQIVGRLIYEALIEPPETLYGAGLGSHYQAQGLKLSKHFR
jgi:dCTP deaminase